MHMIYLFMVYDLFQFTDIGVLTTNKNIYLKYLILAIRVEF